MSKHADFLVEIHTAELPPKALQRLGTAFLNEIEERLRKSELSFATTHYFAAPRRLAVLIENLSAKQADTSVERKGPAIEAAFDKNNLATPACVGFARSCGVTPEQLMTIKNDSGVWVGFQQHVVGKTVHELMPVIVQQALAALPIPKRMRWGNSAVEFVRPVQSIIMLYGENIIDAEILGCKTGRITRGHRFLSTDWLKIGSPKEYTSVLAKAFVIADFNQRKESIRQQAEAIVKKSLEKTARVVITDALLDEVTGLVEWPVAICGSFEKKFLEVPQEALISAMQDHQRYFPIVDENNKLLPHFVTISNIQSKDEQRVIAGNERVLRARLSDAAFFFETDKKHSLESRVNHLAKVVFQAKLGSMHDKAERISQLAGFIATQIGANPEQAMRLGLLAKADLTTEIVGEFPELQGTAGYYYAMHDGILKNDAAALYEQYMPRFSGDALPSTLLGFALAIADRIDSLVGVFGINQAPTGDKDPFGLRRSALGVLRILIEKKLALDLHKLLQFAATLYAAKLENVQVVDDVFHFMLERLKPWYQEQGISSDVLAAVAALNITVPYNIHCRIQAVQAFKKLPEAESLSIANKRVSNILAKYTTEIVAIDIDEKLFETEVERVLAKKIKEHQHSVISLSKASEYDELLSQLAHLRGPVDDFFAHVLVMTENQAQRENRLLLLKKLRELFLYVADIALLQ